MSRFSEQDIEIMNRAFAKADIPKIVFTRKEVISKTIDYGRLFCENLLQCAFYPFSSFLEGWLINMYGWFSYICDLTIVSNGKRLTSKTFLDYFITAWLEFPNDITRIFYEGIYEEYHEAVFFEEPLFQKIQEFSKTLAQLYIDKVDRQTFFKEIQLWLNGIKY